MHNWRIWTHDLMHTFRTSNHYAASVNISVLLLSLTKIIYKNHCTDWPRHLAAGVEHPAARAPQRPPTPSRSLGPAGPDSEVLVLPVAAAAPASQWHAGSLKLPWLAVAPDCTQVEKHLQAAAGQLAGRSAMNRYEGGHSGLATASGTGTVIVARAISACGTGQCHASSKSDCRASKHKP